MSNNNFNVKKQIVYLDASQPLTPSDRQRLVDKCRLMYGSSYTVILNAPTLAQYNDYLQEVVRRYEQGQQEGKNSVEWLKECYHTTPLKRTAKRLL